MAPGRVRGPAGEARQQVGAVGAQRGAKGVAKVHPHSRPSSVPSALPLQALAENKVPSPMTAAKIRSSRISTSRISMNTARLSQERASSEGHLMDGFVVTRTRPRAPYPRPPPVPTLTPAACGVCSIDGQGKRGCACVGYRLVAQQCLHRLFQRRSFQQLRRGQPKVLVA